MNIEKKPAPRDPSAPADRIAGGFINSRWRYSQFVIVGLIVAGLVGWLSPLGWPLSLLAGALAGIGLWLVEKKRGVL